SDGGPLIVPLRADLPAGYDAGDDLVKVIAALHPVGLRAAELPPLDQRLPADRGRTRSVRGDPLGYLLAAVDASPSKTRAVAAFSRPGKEWAAAQCSIRIERPKCPAPGRQGPGAV